MIDLTAELRAIVRALNDAGVTYALAGGLAVSIYATPRATQDIDLLLAVSDLDATIAAASRLGFRVAGRPMPVAAGRMDIQRVLKIDGADLLPLDLLLPRDPELAAILTDRIRIDWEGTRLSVVTVDGLRRLKIRAGPCGPRGTRSGGSVRGEDVTARLRTVSALRSLCLRLPHVPTPAELERWNRFGELAGAPERVSRSDVDALVTGWSRWWREGRKAELSAMVERVDRALIDGDRRLATLAVASRAR